MKVTREWLTSIGFVNPAIYGGEDYLHADIGGELDEKTTLGIVMNEINLHECYLERVDSLGEIMNCIYLGKRETQEEFLELCRALKVQILGQRKTYGELTMPPLPEGGKFVGFKVPDGKTVVAMCEVHIDQGFFDHYTSTMLEDGSSWGLWVARSRNAKPN